LALAGIRSTQKDGRASPLPRDTKAMRFLAAAFFNDNFLLELGDFRFQFGLKVVGPLMFGDLLHHHLKALQFLFECLRATILLLGLQVLLGKIGGHGSGTASSASGRTIQLV
jgi:hypothetical protein